MALMYDVGRYVIRLLLLLLMLNAVWPIDVHRRRFELLLFVTASERGAVRPDDGRSQRANWFR